MKTFRIEIEGLVQGVGFRPFIYKLASSMGLEGTVENLNTGVRVYINCNDRSATIFLSAMEGKAPVQAHIESVSCIEEDHREFSGFSIIHSHNLSDEITRISPDIAVCTECLDDMKHQEHRINYPLINCTNCGPRFSIIKGVPYDRGFTTMSHFDMCRHCSAEYDDVENRRFHAQPVACNYCGPEYRMLLKGETISGIDEICSMAAALIDMGEVIAVKGTGGYHLVCNAMDESVVAALRKAKEREGKPFAVMCRDIDSVSEVAHLTKGEVESLLSWQRPVLITDGRGKVAPSVSNGLDTLGVILPYMPFHYLLFENLKTDVIVFTSANIAEDPVIIDDEQSETELRQIAGAIISYNREIYNRTDDSVERYIAGEVRILRRSRGYAPSPVKINCRAEGIFGAGAELANCFAVGKNREVILSQHIGDLKNASTSEFYETAYSRFADMFRFSPTLVARDIHPDYLSSAFADRLADEISIPVTLVQHHHAHIASCMAENGVAEKVIGVAMDGVGLGSDGKIWGGEFMVADLCSFERILHFDYVPVAGGDLVSLEPWRSGLSWLDRYIGLSSLPDSQKLVTSTGSEKTRLYTDIVGKAINTIEYSSAGRLFDAVASIIGINNISTYHSEAPMRLESAIIKGVDDSYEFDLHDGVISFGPAIVSIVSDLAKNKPEGLISAMFHNCVAKAIIQGVRQVSDVSGISAVALSGGTFQNRYLTEKVISRLKSEKYTVYFHQNIPANDGGLALGQIAVAAARREAGLII